MGNAPDEIGNKYGNLTVIKRLENKVSRDSSGKITKQNSVWLCRCSCGNEVPVISSNFRRGNSRSCGQCNPPERASMHAMYLRYRASAHKRNYKWELTENEFETITSKNCTYCNASPSQISNGKTYRAQYIYNGIDRVDNAIGYTISNCVPCCKTCNSAKGTLTSIDFIKWIHRIYNHHILGIVDTND